MSLLLRTDRAYDAAEIGGRDLWSWHRTVLEARDTAARNADGWHVCLAALEQDRTGQGPAGPCTDSPNEQRPIYDAYVADGLPSGAPVPGLRLKRLR